MLRNLLKKKVISVSRDALVQDVAKIMHDEDVGSLLVVESQKPIGIVTDRDIVLRTVAEGLDPRTQRVAEIMTDSVETVADTDGIFDVAEKMKKKQIRRIPVVDNSGIAVGLVSFGDIFELLAQELQNLAEPASPDKKKLQESVA